MLNPEDFGSGKKITPEQSVEYAQENWQKFIMMLMLRLGVEEVVLGWADLQLLLVKMREKNGLGILLDMDGVHLKFVGKGFNEGATQ